MIFEKYLTENCRQRILDSLISTDPENRECTLPGSILDDESFDVENGTFCQPVGLEVERVYYKPCDMVCAGGNVSGGEQSAEERWMDEKSSGEQSAEERWMDEKSSGESKSSADLYDLAFTILFHVEFLTFRIDQDSVSEPAKITRKYYASCIACIDDGALRNFRMTDIHDRNLMAELDMELQRKQGELSRFPVRAMTDEELERRADAFLERYCPEAKKEPMRVPVRTIFTGRLGLKLWCDSDKNRFTTTCEGCRQLWDSAALKLLELLDEKDGVSPFPEAMYHIMDRNAKRTAAGILMPAAALKQLVRSYLGAYGEELKNAEAGDILKCMVYSLAEEYDVSVQAMKIRLEDLGFSVFSGVLNHLDGEYVPAFTTSEDAPEECRRYLIGMSQLKELLSDRPELLDLCEQEALVYIEGKLVLNQCQYVQEEAGQRSLTPYARTHVDECCIRFRGMGGRGRSAASGKASLYEFGRNSRLRGSFMKGSGRSKTRE